MMQYDFVPLHFETFKFLKKNFHNISKAKDEQPVECHAVSLKLMENRLHQSFQVFRDPIVDVLDDICSKIPSPLANYEPEKNVDINLIQQPTSLSCLAGVSLKVHPKIYSHSRKITSHNFMRVRMKMKFYVHGIKTT